MSDRAIISQSAESNRNSDSATPMYLMPEFLALMALCAAVAGMQLWGGRFGKKTKLASSYLGGSAEISNARRVAYRQIRNRKPNAVSLWIHDEAMGPRSLRGGINPDKAIYLCDLQRGTAIVGGPGSGKTYSSIDPLICAAIRSRYPIILYDYKYPTQTARHVALAAQHGYDLHIYAPGFPESGTFNVLDAMENPEDAETARQIAAVLNRNMRPLGSTPDAFFGPAQDQLTTAALQLAKTTNLPDLLTCQAVLNVADLPKRVEQSPQINPWVKRGFDQLKVSSQSERTMASIKATAIANFQKFLSKQLLASITGRSTIPFELEGRQMLVLGLDRGKADAVRPLLAIALDAIVTKNLHGGRRDPLCVFLDELPTLQLPRLSEWLNTGREDGLVGVLGFQNYAQLEDAYGRPAARSILGACSTKLIFNPQDFDSAQTMSNFVGNLEVSRKTKSTSHGKGSTSRTLGEQDHVRKVVEPSDLLRYSTGKCLIVNPGLSNKTESNIAVVKELNVCGKNQKLASLSQQRWPQIREDFSLQQVFSVHEPDDALKLRKHVVEHILEGTHPPRTVLPPAADRGVYFREGQPNPGRYMNGSSPKRGGIRLNIAMSRSATDEIAIA